STTSRKRKTKVKCDWSSDVCSSDLVKPVQLMSSPSGACPTVNAMVLDPAADAGKQLYICRLDSNTNSNAWVQVNDDSTLTASVRAEEHTSKLQSHLNLASPLRHDKE